MQAVNRGRGRPREGRELKATPLSVKTTPELRQRVEIAARASRWSITKEVEFRLNLSFDLEADQKFREVARAARTRSEDRGD